VEAALKMFWEIAQYDKSPTPYEIARLRMFEVTGRLNSILLETFDLGTDIAFALVLFNQAGVIDLPEAWDFYKSTTNVYCPNPPINGVSSTFFMNLGIATASFIGISTFFRLSYTLYTVITKNSEINGTDWWWVLLGTFVSIVDPWNGSLIINSIMETKRVEKDDYTYAVAEFQADILLLAFENVPQLILQIVYIIVTVPFGLTTVAWYTAIFTTVLHLSSQVHEIVSLGRQLPKLRKTSVTRNFAVQNAAPL